MEKQINIKNCLIVILLLLPLLCRSQHNRKKFAHTIPYVEITDPSFYSAIDTLLLAEKDNGIFRDTNCPIYVNVQKSYGFMRIISLKNRHKEFPCVPTYMADETLITTHKCRLIYIFFFGMSASEWSSVPESLSPVSFCEDKEDEESIEDDELEDYLCIILYAKFDQTGISVKGKEIIPYSATIE